MLKKNLGKKIFRNENSDKKINNNTYQCGIILHPATEPQ